MKDRGKRLTERQWKGRKKEIKKRGRLLIRKKREYGRCEREHDGEIGL